jgi:DNA-directed RNA polymerase
LSHSRVKNQFRERYKGYKVPLGILLGSRTTLVKQLIAAGTRIKAHRSQETILASFKSLIDFTDDSEITNVSEATGLEVATTDPDQLQDDEKLLEALDEEEEIPKTKQAAKAKAAADAIGLLSGKVVNLTDLIPPLPDKGSFEVESIKESQYFFS